MLNDETRAVAESVSAKATYVASTVTVFAGLTANEVAAIGGLFIALVGLVVNFWFKWDRRRLDRTILLDQRKGERRDSRARCAVCPYREEQAP